METVRTFETASYLADLSFVMHTQMNIHGHISLNLCLDPAHCLPGRTKGYWTTRRTSLGRPAAAGRQKGRQTLMCSDSERIKEEKCKEFVRTMERKLIGLSWRSRRLDSLQGKLSKVI